MLRASEAERLWHGVRERNGRQGGTTGREDSPDPGHIVSRPPRPAAASTPVARWLAAPPLPADAEPVLAFCRAGCVGGAGLSLRAPRIRRGNGIPAGSDRFLRQLLGDTCRLAA